MKVIHVEFPHHQFILRFGHDILKPKTRIYAGPWGLSLSNYISWRNAVCGYPHFISGPSKITGLIGNEERHFFDSLIGDDPCPWIVNLPPIRGEIDDDDGYNGLDEELFSRHFKFLFEDLEEKEREIDEYFWWLRYVTSI
jgi:hypothetical protein